MKVLAQLISIFIVVSLFGCGHLSEHLDRPSAPDFNPKVKMPNKQWYDWLVLDEIEKGEREHEDT